MDKNNRINFIPPSVISIDIDWQELVLKPTDKGDFAEAFASADAILDNSIESILRQIYSDFKCQDLINELHLLRSKIGFQGLTILEILRNKTVVKQDLYERVLNFKKARNLVLHNIKREYSLVDSEKIKSLKSQKDYNKLAKSEANKWLNEGYSIFLDLNELSNNLNTDNFFSHEFYKNNPRGKLSKSIFPKKNKIKNKPKKRII